MSLSCPHRSLVMWPLAPHGAPPGLSFHICKMETVMFSWQPACWLTDHDLVKVSYHLHLCPSCRFQGGASVSHGSVYQQLLTLLIRPPSLTYSLPSATEPSLPGHSPAASFAGFSSFSQHMMICSRAQSSASSLLSPHPTLTWISF